MIRGALSHLPGIGPKRLERLRTAGVDDWRALLEQPALAGLGPAGRDKLTKSIARCEKAVKTQDILFLTRTLAQKDRWRILARHFDEATFFDIETSGLDMDSEITIVSCLHRGSLHSFLRGESLDGFLDLLDDVKLLVSFNGASFDVPRVEDAFHIPECPCAHIDLRWLCYHVGMTGGLKSIERELGIRRPADLSGVDGEEAVWLWEMWEKGRDEKARLTLERYCGADVLSLKRVAARLLETHGCRVACESDADLWAKLQPTRGAAARGFPSLPTPVDSGVPVRTPLERRLRASRQRRRAGKAGPA